MMKIQGKRVPQFPHANPVGGGPFIGECRGP